MKIELNRSEMEMAVKCHLKGLGVDLTNKEVKCTFGREIVTVSIDGSIIEDVSVEEVETPETEEEIFE